MHFSFLLTFLSVLRSSKQNLGVCVKPIKLAFNVCFDYQKNIMNIFYYSVNLILLEYQPPCKHSSKKTIIHWSIRTRYNYCERSSLSLPISSSKFSRKRTNPLSLAFISTFSSAELGTIRDMRNLGCFRRLLMKFIKSSRF